MKKFLLSLLIGVPALLCADDVYYWTERPKRNAANTVTAAPAQPAQAPRTARPEQPLQPTDGTAAITYVSEKQDTVVMVIHR